VLVLPGAGAHWCQLRKPCEKTQKKVSRTVYKRQNIMLKSKHHQHLELNTMRQLFLFSSGFLFILGACLALVAVVDGQASAMVHALSSFTVALFANRAGLSRV
jgi:hypothetical protein